MRVEAERFLSIVDDEVAAISYRVTANEAANVELAPFLDFNVVNSDANWEETFWAQQGHASAAGTSATCDRLRRAFPSSHVVQWLASGRPLAGTYFSSVLLLVDDAVINMVVVFCFGYDATVGWSSCSSPKNEATKFT